MIQNSLPVRLKGVVFDMDGTLTVPCVDFGLMRQRLGLSRGCDILHVISTYDAEQKAKALSIIAEFEENARKNLQIMPGAHELCQYLDKKSIRRGLLTRNVAESVDVFHSHFPALPFLPALSREFLPFKPHPEPLLHICQQWGVEPSSVLMVGDSAHDDVLCGHRAGAYTLLLDEAGKYADGTAFEAEEHKPHFMARTLHEVVNIIEKNFIIDNDLPVSA
eukprot:jgi/Mesvir1/23220/Mv22677-RA.1